MPDPSAISVLVTGANGNLGRKLVAHLAEAPWCSEVVALDLDAGAIDDPKVRAVAADLARRSSALDEAAAGAQAAVHLAAQRPYPDATWADGSASLDMTLNLVEALARAGGPKRLVFASSNHVMGGYKEEEVAPGALTTALPPRPGTRTGGGEPERAYAAAKLMGERVLAARAERGGLTAVSLRIGWCQPGDNRPGTMTASGIPRAPDPTGGEPSVGSRSVHGLEAGGPTDPNGPAIRSGRTTREPGPDTPEAARTLRWFRGMWLSNRDFLAAVSAALTADAAPWPAPAIVVNAMSANAGMAWDIASTRALVGYAPQDDSSLEVVA